MTKKKNRLTKAFLGYKDVLTGALLKLAVNPSDVDDILQESLTRALEAEKNQGIRHPKSYLYKVSRNLVFREQQRRAREVQKEIDEALLDSDEASTEVKLHYKQMLAAFWEAMDSLPARHRQAILLRRLYGLTQKEVAKKMGVSLSSVEKYFAQGIRRCQETLKKRGFELSDMPSPARPSTLPPQTTEIAKGRRDGK